MPPPSGRKTRVTSLSPQATTPDLDPYCPSQLEQTLAELAHDAGSPLQLMGVLLPQLARGLKGHPEQAALAEGVARLTRAAIQLELAIHNPTDAILLIQEELNLERVPLDLNLHVPLALRQLLPLAAGRGVEIERETFSGAIPILADPRRLTRAIQTCLLWAMKHTPPRDTLWIRGPEVKGPLALLTFIRRTQPQDLLHLPILLRPPWEDREERPQGLGPRLYAPAAILRAHGGALRLQAEQTQLRCELSLPLASPGT